MKISKIANKFLSYYQSNGAEILDSAPLIHPLFPMSFNMSAGLVQLDPLLRSKEIINNKKMVVVQKCFRHFDIKNITDISHLSFFEMGGYFEVGELNKKEAVSLIYNFLVNELKIDSSKLWVTVFAGDEVYDHKFPKDNDVMEIWKNLLINKEHIVEFGKENNYWVQGGGAEIAIESKLCGSQTEIFFDLGKNDCKEANCLPNCSCGRFLELSNNLFITHKITGELKVLPLSNKAIESVIGIERVAIVTENKKSVYEIEDLKILTENINENNKNLSKDETIKRKGRIIDHLRALCFLIPEGAPQPGRNGRARIMRTLIRELLTDCYVLDINTNEAIHNLVEKIIRQYFDRYPEIKNKTEAIFQMVFEHEKVFLETLKKASVKMKRFLTKNNKSELDEKEKEYFRKQFGMPIELQEKYLTYE